MTEADTIDTIVRKLNAGDDVTIPPDVIIYWPGSVPRDLAMIPPGYQWASFVGKDGSKCLCLVHA